MKVLLSEAGYRDYAIFRFGDLIFGTFATDDLKSLLDCLRASPVAARWRASMSSLVENEPDPVTGHQPLLEPLFYHP